MYLRRGGAPEVQSCVSMNFNERPIEADHQRRKTPDLPRISYSEGKELIAADRPLDLKQDKLNAHKQ